MAEKVENGDFVTVDYVGRVKDTGKIFDLTNEETAKKEKLYDEHSRYGAVTIVVGAKHLLSGLEKALVGLAIGEKKKVEVSADDGFGSKNPELVKLVPHNVFSRERINPVPGLPVKIGNNEGIVQTVSGGRVKVDFNHPLAGKTLEYEVEISKKLTDVKEKIKSLFEFHLPKIDLTGVKIDVKGDTAEVETPSEKKTRTYINITKDIIARDILAYINDIKRLRFVDNYTKEEKEKKEEKA